MEKRERCRGIVFLVVLFTLFCSSTVLASSDNQTAIDKAETCLKNEINNKTSLTLDQAIFSAMVMKSNSKIEDALSKYKDSKECWPKGNCQLKESSQVALALNRRGSDTNKVANWIISKNSTPNELVWYLEIDSQNHEPAVCSVQYGSRKEEIEIAKDMSISRNTATDCLTISDRGYWLKISSSCLSKQFKISCDTDFVSSLLYQKKDGDTVYVSSESHRAASNSSTTEEVKVKCLADGQSCNYEGTLWAVFALDKIGKDITPYIPYLVALAEDNTKYFPSAFLYALVSKDAGSDEFYNTIIQKQMRNGFWEISGSKYGRYYDSSLAMLGLGGKSASEVDDFKEALYEEQNSKGCWSSVDPIRDTSFILYSVWGEMINVGGGSGGSGGGSEPRCESKGGQSCQIKADCTAAEGEELIGYLCSGGEICCSKEIPLKSCSEEKGEICLEDEECDENVIATSDGSCCLGTCEKIEIPTEDDTCTLSGGECKSSCSSGEKEDQSKTCTGAENLCCIQEGGGISWWLILLLIVLIAAVIAAIIYRDKLRVWWYARRGKASVSPVIKPGVPPFSGEPRSNMTSQRPMQIQPRPAQRALSQSGALPPRRPPQRDKDMEETLKKLKEISE